MTETPDQPTADSETGDGLALSSLAQSLTMLAGVIPMIGAIFSGPSNFIGLGIAVIIDIPFILLAVFLWKSVADFRREHRAAYDAGQQKIDKLPLSERFIWKTDARGEPIKRSTKK